MHTLDRSTFWMTIPPAFRATFNPAMQATAERGTRQNCVEFLMTFLLRPPIRLGASVDSVGSVALNGLSGQGVRVSLPGGEGNTFVFDPKDGQPLGYVAGAPTGSTGNDQRAYVLFRGYSTQDGRRFPSHIEFHYPPRSNVVDWKIAEVRVNDVSPSVFSEAAAAIRN